MRKQRDSELVYSSDEGDLRRGGASRSDPDSGRGPGRSGGGGGRKKGKKREAAGPAVRPPAGTRMKVRRETSGRRGKAVTTVSDIPLSDADIKGLGNDLKRRCGVGGTAKNGVIELQGDHRDKVLEYLKAAGYDAVAAGG